MGKEFESSSNEKSDMSNKEYAPGTGNRPVLNLLLKGFCMGTADVIPGVSGGTMAFILGIYRELIEAIRSFDRSWLLAVFRFDCQAVFQRPHFKFIIPLLAGIVCALLFFTRIVPLPELLLAYPEQVYGLFFGLITGSCVILLFKMKNLKIRDIAFIITGILPGFVLFNLGPIITPDTPVYVFMAGFFAISAMLLPGISGSFILLILNKYAYIFNAIGYFRIAVILPFAAGMLVGLIFFSRLLSWVLRRYLRQTTLVITGFLLSSLWMIWPYQERQYEMSGDSIHLISTVPFIPTRFDGTSVLTLMLAIAGYVAVILINRMANLKAVHAE